MQWVVLIASLLNEASMLLTILPCRCQCWLVADLSLPDKSNQAASASGIDQSSNSLTGADRMDCWRLRVDAADAKKADGASICALLMPSPPCRTGSEAWSHCDSVRSTFKTEQSPCLRVLSNVVRSGLSEQLDVWRIYRSFGTLRLFLSKTKALRKWTNDSRSKAFRSGSTFCFRTVSWADPLSTGALKRLISSLHTFMKWLRIDDFGIIVESSMTSHF